VQPTDLTEVVEAAVDAFRPAAEAKGVDLRSAPPAVAGAVSVAGDPVRLQQVVSNLLSNAVKFTPAHGRIEVRLQRAPAAARIVVQDTGQGIVADFLPRVFDPFRQADSSSTRTHGGLGLGLAIVRHLVELHGGGVEAASAGTGRGATFTVTLPLLATGCDERATRPGPSGASRLEGVHVLLVDDEEDARQVLATALELSGAAVTAVASAREALRAVERVTADVLVSDIAMPDMDGYDLLHELRLRPTGRGSRLPAVALTAYAGREHRLRALDAGYAMHLSKPVGIPELLSAVAQLAGQRAKPTV
jgi:CheY-like chemotaxis protein